MRVYAWSKRRASSACSFFQIRAASSLQPLAMRAGTPARRARRWPRRWGVAGPREGGRPPGRLQAGVAGVAGVARWSSGDGRGRCGRRRRGVGAEFPTSEWAYRWREPGGGRPRPSADAGPAVAIRTLQHGMETRQWPASRTRWTSCTAVRGDGQHRRPAVVRAHRELSRRRRLGVREQQVHRARVKGPPAVPGDLLGACSERRTAPLGEQGQGAGVLVALHGGEQAPVRLHRCVVREAMTAGSGQEQQSEETGHDGGARPQRGRRTSGERGPR
jgi:hypothetical protein